MMDTQTQETGRKLSALQAMADNFGRKFETDLLRFWMRLLGSYSADAVEAAALAIVETRPYPTMPTFAEFRRYLPGMKALTAEDADKVKARQEFDLVWQAICRHGSHREPQFGETTAAVIRSLGGWQAICETWQEADRVWKERDFCSLWQLYSGHESLLGQGAEGVERGLALGAPESVAALESPVPAGVCPECHGSGWITAWREGKLTSNAFPCVCNHDWDGKHFTRAELADAGWVFTEPQRPQTITMVRQPRTNSFHSWLDRMRNRQTA